MEWINIKINGQPKKDGMYLAFNGETYDRMYYINGKWKSQHKIYKPKNQTLLNNGWREDMTKYVTHYIGVILPTKLSEQNTTSNTSEANLNIPDVSVSFKEKLQQIIDDKESSVSERLGNIKFLLLNER